MRLLIDHRSAAVMHAQPPNQPLTSIVERLRSRSNAKHFSRARMYSTLSVATDFFSFYTPFYQILKPSLHRNSYFHRFQVTVTSGIHSELP
jgi:hypothetical protein